MTIKKNKQGYTKKKNNEFYTQPDNTIFYPHTDSKMNRNQQQHNLLQFCLMIKSILFIRRSILHHKSLNIIDLIIKQN